MEQAAQLASEGTSTGPTPRCYLQAAWAVVRWLLAREPAMVLDLEAQQ